jgi:predicted DNA-binding protein
MARTKPRSDKVLTIRIPEKDLQHLEAYCIAYGKTKTEVIRGLIQQLETVAAESSAAQASMTA